MAMGEGAGDAAPLPERRGYLLNEYTGSREYFILRGGVLRVRQSPRGPDTGSVYLAHGSGVKLLANCVLEVSSKVPYVQEYILAATSEREAEGWHDAIKASITSEQLKMQKLMELLENGCTMHKYNYSNSKRSRRYFWVGDGGKQLCWGRSKGEDTQSVNLSDCIGIIYGPMTTTFQRCPTLEDSAYTCFSLLFMGRTLDLTVAGDLQVCAWFLGMQHLISLHGMGSMPMMSEAQFVTRKVQYKIQAAAHSQGLVLGRFLLERVRAVAAGRGLAGLGPGAGVSGGRLAVPMSLAQASSAETARSGRREKRRENGVTEDPEAAKRIGALKARASQVQATLRERSVQAEALDAALKKAADLPPEGRQAAMQSALKKAAVTVLSTRCASLEEEVQRLSESAEQASPQVKEAQKSEKALRKMWQKLEESQARRDALARRLRAAQESNTASHGAKQTSSTVEAGVKGRNAELQREELERQGHKAAQSQHVEQEEAKNREQDAAIAQAERERLALAQKLEDTRRQVAKAKELEAQSQDQLARTRDQNSKLETRLRPLLQVAAYLKDEQRKARGELLEASKTFSGQVVSLMDACGKVGAEVKDMEEAFRKAMEDRKRLHNQVLDLKGNIRVFVRVRPINAKETPHEPEGEATVNFKDDMGIGIFAATHGRRKWFEFDQVFDPSAAQSFVFEEAKPLAASVLDGYNVCIFAYGQTGSGKTHTMNGTLQDPGLNTNVLRELFRIRDERRGESEINISLSITEIYNEVIRDLLCPTAKKLDVKIHQDGSCGVPGLEERKVLNVDDVLKSIQDAQKNRATSTTDMNEQSSRSHSIVTVRTRCTILGGDTFVGKINLIDLAGSENTNKSGVTGQGMKEAQNINKSLASLGDVISSLVSKSPHTPYRNSKLTMMLKDSLGGDSKTLMIVCTSPAQFNVTETLSSLNFASRARNVELGQAKRKTEK